MVRLGLRLVLGLELALRLELRLPRRAAASAEAQPQGVGGHGLTQRHEQRHTLQTHLVRVRARVLRLG